MKSFLSPLLRARGRPFVLQDLDAAAILATTVDAAVDSATRRRGLLGRTEYPDGSALVIAPCSAIHTFFMRMMIDVIFVSRGGRVLKTYARLPAWRLAFELGAYAVIELPADTLSRTSTQCGNRLALTEAE